MAETSVWITLVDVTCGVCGVHFGLEREVRERLEENGRWFYCPNGHRIKYLESENQRLQRELTEARQRADRAAARERATRDLLRHEEASHRATRGHVTRKKKQLERVKNGVCPCCNRSFENLARHMESKHPEYQA